jgi:hypothetical protein
MNWRNLHEHDYFLFARSYNTAAKKLARTLDLDSGPIPDFDLCPVLSAYRHAVEIHLKVIVLGEGGNFLAKRPDELSVHKTRSLSWLAQFVVQIVTNLKWEDEFKTEGIESIAAFQAVIEEANQIDPTFHAFRSPAIEGPDAVTGTLRDAVVAFVRRLDALIGILESTADALAAEWDLRSGTAPDDQGDDGGFKPTIH